jgi:hypothetical protein
MDLGTATVAPHGDASHALTYVHLGGGTAESVTGDKTFTDLVLIKDGTHSAPGLAIASSTGLGLFKTASGNLGIAGAEVDFHNTSGAYASLFVTSLGGGLALGLNDGIDVFLMRDTANSLALRNGAAAQSFSVYTTYTDPSNFERGRFYSDGVDLVLGVDALGTGASTRSLHLRTSGSGSVLLETGGTARWSVDASGHLMAAADNTYDVGASAATRPRNVYVANGITAGGDITSGGKFHGDGSALTGITGGSGGVANTGTTTIESDSDSSGNEDIALKTSGSVRWLIRGGTGHLFANSDSAYDIGASAANRPRDLYLGRDLYLTGQIKTALTVNHVGPHAIGGATTVVAQFRLTGSFTGGAGSPNAAFYLDSTVTPPAGTTFAFGHYLQPTLVKAGSSTHDVFASLGISAPSITAGASTLNNAAALFILGPATVGTRKYGLWVDTLASEVGLALFGDSNITMTRQVAIVSAANDAALMISRGANTKSGFLELLTGNTQDWIVGLRNTTDSDFRIFSAGTAADALVIARATGIATFASEVKIGNTVNAVSPTSPNRTITLVVGGVTLYVHAKTTNN